MESLGLFAQSPLLWVWALVILGVALLSKRRIVGHLVVLVLAAGLVTTTAYAASSGTPVSERSSDAIALATPATSYDGDSVTMTLGDTELTMPWRYEAVPYPTLRTTITEVSVGAPFFSYVTERVSYVLLLPED